MLLLNGANVNAADDVGYTAMHLAAKHGLTEATNLLLKHGAIANFQQEKKSNDNSLSQALGELIQEPINLALDNNHAEVVELLLKHGVSPNNTYFLGKEINVLPLENARCLELLLEYGAEPDSFGRSGLTPLMKACKQEAEEAIHVLLKHGANVNLTPPKKFDQKTALYFTAINGNDKIAEMLLEKNACTKRAPNYDYSPLEMAVTRGHLELCATLIKYGASVNELDLELSSPLQVACWAQPMKNRYSITELLLRNGAEPNYNSGRYSYAGPSLCPVVEYFTSHDELYADMVKLLIKYGAVINICRSRKFSRMLDASGVLEQLYKLSNYDDIMTLLISAADRYDLNQINDTSDLSVIQKEYLLNEGRMPRTLRHLTRSLIRKYCTLPLPISVRQLPLPVLLQSYLLFEQ